MQMMKIVQSSMRLLLGHLKPESADAYDIPEIAGLYEGEKVAELKKVVHDLGLTPAQAKGFIERVNTDYSSIASEAEARKIELETEASKIS